MNATWKACQADVNNDYPLLAILEADFRELVKAASRHLAEERLQTKQERWKREANPNFLDSKAYQRAVRHQRRARGKADARLSELADAAGLPRAVFGVTSDGAAPATSEQSAVAGSLKRALLRQIRTGAGSLDNPPPHHHLLTALQHCGDDLPEAESQQLGLERGSSIAAAVEALLGHPKHVIYDLHGYRVDEATEYADRRVKEAWEGGCGFVTLIHGSPEVTHWSGVRSLAKGGIKWSLRGRLSQGAWDEYVHPRRSARHRIGEGSMTLAIRPRTVTSVGEVVVADDEGIGTEV